MAKIYECTRNSDQTEGRGRPVAFAWTDNLDDAIELVKGQGVMGVGDGEVDEIDTEGSHRTMSRMYPGTKRTVYGYHQNWRGQWVHGRVDEDTDIPEEEQAAYAEYMRLHARFGGRNVR